MADIAVNIARALLHDQVILTRPPSGKTDRNRIINNYTRQLTSVAAKNIGSSSAKKSKPPPPTSNMKLFIKLDESSRGSRTDFPNNTKNTLNHRPTSNSPNAVPHRRTQSARERLPPRNSSAHKKRPVQSAKVTWGKNQTKHSSNIYSSNINYDRPGARSHSLENCALKYKNKFGSKWVSEPDLSMTGKPLKSCLKNSSKLSVNDLTDEALGVVIDDEDSDSEHSDSDSEESALPLPKSLRPLASYWTPDIPPQYLGIDHLHCWVFLPSMVMDYRELPVVPSKVTDPTEDLPYQEKIVETRKLKKRVLDSRSCHHASDSSKTSVPPLQVYNPDGRLIHETSRQVRTLGVIRREIEELELLMKGIGTAGGCSIVVQYQYEINKLQDMVNNTLGRVEEIERRERERLNALEAKQQDYCGLRKFYREHDDVVRQIRLQHSKCVRELALLERDLKIDSSRAHFRKVETE